jgi:phage terminase large subunit-like protein
MAGNRCGKSIAGAYEMALHLTGEYPTWWEGFRVNHPGRYWAAGKTNEKTREIVQTELFGQLMRQPGDKPGEIVGIGTGMIRGDLIKHVEMRPNVPNAIQTGWIKHVSGGVSVVGFKSYEMGRGGFEGTAQDGIWLDEECPIEIFTECVMRTMTTGGRIWLTFTPLEGLSETVLQFLPNGIPEAA